MSVVDVEKSRVGSIIEVVGVFLRLGLSSFGGPVAHIAYFHREIVDRRRWIDESEFAELLALCQFLPGPASSQLVFAIAQRRAGIAAAILASLAFLAPSATLMILFALGLGRVGIERATSIVHGLKLAAVPVVAHAVVSLWRRLCPDRSGSATALAAAVIAFIWPFAAVQVAVIGFGMIVGFATGAGESRGETASPPTADRSRPIGAASLLLFFVVLLGVSIVVSRSGSREASLLAGFYRSGALVFGGGHVVLPLLRADLVGRGYVGDSEFLAGYGAAQAVPGPLFSFAAFLGAAAHPGPYRWVGGIAAVLAIFLPGWLLIAGAVPFWRRWRSRPILRSAHRGADAAVVGLLASALVSPVAAEGIGTFSDLLIAAAATALLFDRRFPVIVVILACAAAGAVVHSGNFA